MASSADIKLEVDASKAAALMREALSQAITPRDLFAAAALAGLIGGEIAIRSTIGLREPHCREAYRWADEMLRLREAKP